MNGTVESDGKDGHAEEATSDPASPGAAADWETNPSRYDRRKLKKKRKQIERGGAGTESDITAIYGANVAASLELKLSEYFTNGRSSIRSRELQQLVLWILGEEVAPKWIFVKVSGEGMGQRREREERGRTKQQQKLLVRGYNFCAIQYRSDADSDSSALCSLSLRINRSSSRSSCSW